MDGRTANRLHCPGCQRQYLVTEIHEQLCVCGTILQPVVMMEYPSQEAYGFQAQYEPQVFYQQIPYPTYSGHQQVSGYYMPYGAAEYADFGEAGMPHNEYGDTHEVSTKPRLTKEQAEVLESHFQANHKPSSQVKRELAIQTGLTNSRVGNWFQNRRAKAKQEKRQAEAEANASKVMDDDDDDEVDTAEDESSEGQHLDLTLAASSGESPAKVSRSSTTACSATTARISPSPIASVPSSREASWNSLQRALEQAKAAQAQHGGEGMSQPQQSSMQLPLRTGRHQPNLNTSASTWSNRQAVPYTPPISLQDTSFDFGFDQDTTFEAPPDCTVADAGEDHMRQSFVVTPEGFREPSSTPKGVPATQPHIPAALSSPPLTMPMYSDSRRPSLADLQLSNEASASPEDLVANYSAESCGSDTSSTALNGSIDLAARRKRPRPAALTSLSLRSRSYGAMTSVSPTFRQGLMSPGAPKGVRHVKSAGQNLHSRFAGIRKASSAQRSPMCATTFAEAEAFNQLMANQATVNKPLEEVPGPLFAPRHATQPCLVEPNHNRCFTPSTDMFRAPNIQPHHDLSITTASPPITPMMASYMASAPSYQTLMPPTSAPPQFATFPDYTPPYSAGPMTNSSWSDAPLTSPDLPSFPATYMSSAAFPQQCDEINSQFEQFVLRSDHQPELGLDAMYDENKTEFYIQTFPNQQQEHKSIAQQLNQPKPKSYVFANTAPQDYNAV